jgi:phosphohistidine phosphatase
MLVGHNPGLADLAAALAGSGEPADLSRLRDKLPTGALAILSFDGAWAALGPGCASLESLVVPRDL